MVETQGVDGLNWMAAENDPIWTEMSGLRQEYHSVKKNFCDLAADDTLNFKAVKAYVTSRQKLEKITTQAFTARKPITDKDYELQGKIMDAIGPEDDLWDAALSGLNSGNFEPTITVLAAERDFRRKQVGEYVLRLMIGDLDEGSTPESMREALDATFRLYRGYDQAIKVLKHTEPIRTSQK